MTDEHDQDPALDPREEARIRALLAELGTAPDASSMPPEVAARLDDTLADLLAQREAHRDAATPNLPHGAHGQEAGADVVPIRRRWAPRAAAAAAAVIVVGAGGVAAANLGLFNGADDQSSAGSASSKAETRQETPTPPATASSGTTAVPVVTAAGFDTEVARLLRGGNLTLASGERNGSNRRPGPRVFDSQRLAGCPGPRVSDGAQPTPVLYDGTPAVLLVHPTHAGAAIVEAWTCAGDRVLDRVRVRVPVGGRAPGNGGLASPSTSP